MLLHNLYIPFIINRVLHKCYQCSLYKSQLLTFELRADKLDDLSSL